MKNLLAMELYQVLVRKAIWPTEGMFKGRRILEAKMCYMHWIPNLRLDRSLNLSNLKCNDISSTNAAIRLEEARKDDIKPESYQGDSQGGSSSSKASSLIILDRKRHSTR